MCEKLQRVALPQLSGHEQMQLLDIAECVGVVEKQRRSLDENGARFMLFFRQQSLLRHRHRHRYRYRYQRAGGGNLPAPFSLSLSLSSCMDQDPRVYHASRGYLGALGRPLFLDHQPLFPFSRYSPVPNLLLDLNTRLSSYSHVPDLHSEFSFLVAHHTA